MVRWDEVPLSVIAQKIWSLGLYFEEDSIFDGRLFISDVFGVQVDILAGTPALTRFPLKLHFAAEAFDVRDSEASDSLSEATTAKQRFSKALKRRFTKKRETQAPPQLILNGDRGPVRKDSANRYREKQRSQEKLRNGRMSQIILDSLGLTSSEKRRQKVGSERRKEGSARGSMTGED